MASIGTRRSTCSLRPIRPIQPISTVIVDDHAFIRVGLRAWLSDPRHAGPLIDVVEACADGARGWIAIERHQPDLVLLDMHLPELDGYDILRRIQPMAQRPKVLILSAYAEPLPIRRALLAGADGFVSKCQPPAELLRGIAAVMAGRCLVPNSVARAVCYPIRGVKDPLSRRERCVAEQLVMGHSNVAIAQAMGVSARTVSVHKRNILRKLAMPNVVQLAQCWCS